MSVRLIESPAEAYTRESRDRGAREKMRVAAEGAMLRLTAIMRSRCSYLFVERDSLDIPPLDVGQHPVTVSFEVTADFPAGGSVNLGFVTHFPDGDIFFGHTPTDAYLESVAEQTLQKAVG